MKNYSYNIKMYLTFCLNIYLFQRYYIYDLSQDGDSKDERKKNLRKESDPCTQDGDSKDEREKNLRKDIHELDVPH